MNLQPYLDFATSLVYNAGKITLRYFNTGVRTELKENNDPVTIADREAEAYIRGEIERTYPGHAIVGEEYGENGNGHSFRWIIDPIDGTISFIRGVPLYGVLVGLEVDGIVRVGAAYFPPLDEMLCAADGSGCLWNGRRARVSQVDRLSDACVVSSDFQHLTAKMPDVVDRFRNKKSLMRTWADAYGYLLVATGRAEVALKWHWIRVWMCMIADPILSSFARRVGTSARGAAKKVIRMGRESPVMPPSSLRCWS